MYFLVVLLLSLWQADGLSSLSMSFTPTTINSVGTYTVVFSIGVTTPYDSVVKLTFPSAVSVTDSTSVSCVLSSIYGVSSPTCSVASNVFSVTGVFGAGPSDVSSSIFTISIGLPSITNPSSTMTTSPIGLATYTSSGALLESTTTSSKLAITATASSFTSVSISPESSVIGASVNWLVTMTTSLTIPVGASVQITFPYWNSYIGASGSNLLHIIRASSPSCTVASNMNSPLTGSYSTSALQLTVTGGFTSTKTGTSSFYISGAYNPPTSDSLSGFSIIILDSSSYSYLTSSTLSVQASTANSIDIQTSYIYFGNNTVSTSGYVLVAFVVTNPTYSGVLIDLQIPADIVFSSTMVVSGYSNIASTLSYSSISTNTIRITGGYSAYAAANSISVMLNPVVSPTSTTPTGTFTVTTRSPSTNAIDTGTGASVTAVAGTIYQYSTNSLVTASNLQVGASTTYTFDMQLMHILPSGASLVITFPCQISIVARSSTYACTSVVAGLNSAATCQVASGVLTVIGGFPSGFSPGRVSFSIDQVTNPSTTSVSSTFKYQSTTTSAGTYLVDQKTSGITFTAVAASLVSVTVAPTSMITGAVTVYQFTVVTTNTIPLNGYLKVNFPTGVSISDTVNAPGSCTKVSGFPSSTLTCTVTSSSMTVYGFSSASFSAGTLVWTIGYVMNPPSTASYSSFSAYTYDSSGNGIDQKTSGIAVSVTTANTLTGVVVSSSSTVNGAISTYTFTITVTNVTPSGAYVTISAPSQITLPSSPVCTASTGTSTVLCSYVSSSSFQATVTFATTTIASGSSFSFNLASVVNPGTTMTTSTFMAHTYTSAGYAIDMKTTGITVQTTTAATISSMVISALNSQISVSTSYTISYLPVVTYPSGAILFVTIPSQFILGTVTCTAGTISSSATCLINGSTVTVNNGFPSSVAAASTISFTLNGFTNPSTQLTTSAWVILSVTSDNYLIDTSTTVTSSFTCTTVCLTCTLLASTCTSCSASSAYPYFYSNSCWSSCLTGWYDDPNTVAYTCLECNSLCQSCSTSATTCTACYSGSSYPYLYSNTCNANCPSSYWGNGSICTLCTNPCNACTSASICTSCAVNTLTGVQTYLLSGVCLDNCPSGYTPDTLSLTCLPCTGQCATCSTSASTCTSCVSPYLLQGSICVSSCIADGTYINTGLACDPCISPCYTCTTNTVTCTSCVSTYYLYGTSCTQNCLPGYVGVNGLCVTCTSPCLYCTASPATCTACVSPYLLQLNACLDSCSAGYYSTGLTCEVCTSPCATCSGSATTCTSCSSPNYLLTSTCVTSCPSGTYVPSTGVCLACVSPCTTCSGSTSSCVTCTTGMYLYLSTCVSQCPSGITILVGSTCEVCNSNCLTCSGTVNTCVTCLSTLYLQSGACVDSCSFAYILVNEVCMACNTVCYDCEGTTNTCTACTSNMYLYDSTCVSTCPAGYTPSLGVCVAVVDTGDCAADCTVSILYNTNCDGVCNVAACAYDNGQCNVGPVSCPSGQYECSGSCCPCSSPCNTCTSTATTCTSCLADTSTGALQYLYSNTCYLNCPSSTMISGIICEDCYVRCATCSGTTTTCLTCDSPYLLYDNQCITSCPSGVTVLYNIIYCIDCSSNCLTCTDLYNQCTTCSSPTVLQGTVCQSYCNTGYYADSTGVCQLCSGCATCTGKATTCTSCISGQYLYNSACVTTCPVGTYTSTSTCEACMSTCASCSMAGQCDTCTSGLYLYLTVCVNPCPSGYIVSSNICVLSTDVSLCNTGCTTTLLVDSTCQTLCNYQLCNYDELRCNAAGSCGYGMYSSNGVCTGCVYPCKECTSSTSCTSCLASVSTGNLLLLQGSSCIEQTLCVSGYTAIGVFCEACAENCASCSGTTSTCVSCATGMYLYNGACVSSCPALTTVIVASSCVNCLSTCATCSGTYDNCISCPSGSVLQGGSCVSSCSSGYTTTSELTQLCQACTASCLTCTGETYQCTSCTGGLYLYLNTCVSSCPTDISILQGTTCVPCTSPCLTCSTSVTLCTECIASYALYSSQCVNPCPGGYEDRLGVCTAYCADGCTQALLTNTVCDSICNVEACLYDNNVCLVSTTCPVGQYQSGTVCVDCVSPCNTCASAIYCSSCVVNSDGVQLLLYNGGCYVTCPSGTYMSGLNCNLCSSVCAQCTSSSTYCTACPTGTNLYQNTCVSTCPVGTTINLSSVCYACDNTCLTCAGAVTTCTSCLTGAVLSNSACLPECPSGYTTTDSSDGACVACVGCLTCLSSTSYCTSCVTGLILNLNQCITICPSGYTNIVTNPTTCTQCSSNCAECLNTITYCIACPSGQVLNSINQCQVAATCPDGSTTTSTSLTTCSACLSPCVNCADATTSCTSCITGDYLSGSLCLACNSNCLTCVTSATQCTSCVVGKYVTTTNTCADCTVSCATCLGSATSCTSCPVGLYLSNSECLECDSNCLGCVTTPANCISCKSGYYLVGSVCFQCNSNCATCAGTATTCTSCPSGEFVGNLLTCVACSTTCAECEGASTLCTACTSPEILISNTCGLCSASCATCADSFTVCASCSTGLTLIDGVCGTCASTCLTCAGTFSSCTSCSDGRYLSSSSCLSCNSNCLTCSGTSTSCLSCSSSYSLIDSVCVVCTSPCATCSGTKATCTSCIAATYLSGSACYSCDSTCTGCFSTSSTCTGCVAGYYLSGNQCLQCSSLCLTCSINASLCTSCISTATLTNGVCLLSCPSGYLQIGLACSPCSPTCLTCSGTASTCTTCASGIVYKDACVDSCPLGMYAISGGCQQCSSICKECTGASTYCITCYTGYRLKSNTCEYACTPGQYNDGGVCQPCDATCNTCETTSITCTSCSNSTDILYSDGTCLPPCDSGYLRLSSTSQCEACDPQCGECSGSTKNCTTCKNTALYLYNSICISSCPANTTVAISGVCLPCDSNCLYCESTPYSCTSCNNGTYLYISTCVENCTSGYEVVNDVCVKCYNPLNCSEVAPSNTTTNVTSPPTTFSGKPVPFPFSIVSFGSAGVVGVAKLTSVGVQFMPSAISIWGVLSCASWTFLAGYVPAQGPSGSSRRLSGVGAIGGNVVLTVAFFLIVGALVFHVACNLLFSVTYSIKVSRKDRTYRYWKKHHRKVNLFTMILCYLVSFHCIRLLSCGLCNYDGFKVVYDKKAKVYKPLIKYGYISILCTFIPLIIAQVLILTVLEAGYWLWMFALDSLFITFFLAIMIMMDLKRRETELLKHELERDLGPMKHVEGEELIDSNNSVKDLIDMFPQLDFTSLIPMQPAPRRLKLKWISKSDPGTPVCTPREEGMQRRGSFPLLASDKIELRPESLIPEEKPVEILDEPYGEEILDKGEDFSADLTIIQDELISVFPQEIIPEIIQEPPEPKEFEVTFTEYKDPTIRPMVQRYAPMELEPNTEEFTEIVAYTEEDEPSEEEVIASAPELTKIEEFNIENEVEEPRQSRTNLLDLDKERERELEKERELELELERQRELEREQERERERERKLEEDREIQRELERERERELELQREQELEESLDQSGALRRNGTVAEEADLELDKAVADSKDPELITVIHKDTGQRITVRKGFKGARIVDLENKVIESIAPIDTSKYEVSKTIVDDADVRFATMTAQSGEKVRVKRSFKGARIVDLEKKVSHPHSYLIGQSVKNESDFQFSNAYPDPDDPEVVVVMHNETGEDVKVRKTFHGAQVVDEAGDPVPDVPGIDRNEYDIKKTIVDKEDVHLATLRNKLTNAKVKVRRNFRGAKIVDLERKVDLPMRGLGTILSEKEEPEPLSQEISQNELMGNEMGWITPAYKKSPTKKKGPLKPIAITPKNDEGYDRRKLANLANLIDDLEEESKDWQQPEPYRFISESSEEDQSISSIKPQKKALYHNVDLDTVYAPEFRQEEFEPEQFSVVERKKPRKKNKKKTKKALPGDPQRMKGLEDIYLQRLEGKKRNEKGNPMKGTNDGNFFEPEWERTDSAFEYRPTTTERALPFAGEEIINPRFKLSTPRRDF